MYTNIHQYLKKYFLIKISGSDNYMGASWRGPFCLQDEAQNFALPAKTRSEGK